MSIGIRADSILLNPARIPFYVAIGVVAVLIAAGLGWLLAGAGHPAAAPADRTHQAAGQEGADADRAGARRPRRPRTCPRRWSGCSAGWPPRRRATTNSLQAAQDFAANAAHELRTPLTAMRADLDTLRIHDLPAEERAEVVADLSRAQRRVEAIITALGQLASGQLAQAEDREVIDVTDLLDRVARENMRAERRRGRGRRGCRRRLGTIWGWPGGLRLAVDNLVRNAVTHGPATTRSCWRRIAAIDGWTIVVDDNGRGLPAEEHDNGARPLRAR